MPETLPSPDSRPFTILPWDTAFFGLKVARADMGAMALDTALTLAKEQSIACMYLVVPDAAPRVIEECIRNGAKLVDLRLELRLGEPVANAATPTRLATASDLPRLERLAELLSAASWFSRDPGFAPARVGEMYREWLRRCLAEGVVCVPDSELDGLVGARVDGEGVAHVELVHITADARGGGLARTLVTGALSALATSNAVVVTQAGNIPAQRAYQSLGFRSSRLEAILHLWARR